MLEFLGSSPWDQKPFNLGQQDSSDSQKSSFGMYSHQLIIGGGALGSPRETTEETGRKAAQDFLEAIECGGCVDKYVQVN